METMTIEASDIIPANAETVYAVIADYEVGHQAILPRPAFREMTVLEGGYGAGTRIHLHVRVWGQSSYFEQIVEEPEPGRVIVEREVHTGQYTTFTLDPISDNQTRVTITSVMPISSGWRGWLERFAQPSIMRNLFEEELGKLADYVTRNEVVTQCA